MPFYSHSAEGGSTHGVIFSQILFNFKVKDHPPPYLDAVVVLFEAHSNGFTEDTVILAEMKDCLNNAARLPVLGLESLSHWVYCDPLSGLRTCQRCDHSKALRLNSPM